MKPIRTAQCNVVYRGTSSDVGDLWVARIEPGQIVSMWKPDEEELALLNAGGSVMVYVMQEPIPPLAVSVLGPADSAEVGPHPFKVIEELEDPERSENKETTR